MAKRPVSSSTKPVRDVAAEEESKFLKLAEVAVLARHIDAEIDRLRAQLEIAPGVAVERTSEVWLGLRRANGARVLLRTGTRRFEFGGLCCGAFEDGVEPKLHVLGKDNRLSYVPLPEPGADAIRVWLGLKKIVGESVAPEAPMFCGRGGEFMSLELIRQDWKRVLREAGLPEHGVHGARHTAGLIVYAATGDLKMVGRFLRHDGISVTQRVYLHVDPAQLRHELSEVGLWA